MRKLDRRPRSNFEFVREGQFQKEAEIARIRVSTVIANLCCFLACCIYLGSREEQAGSKAKSLLVACSKSLEMRGWGSCGRASRRRSGLPPRPPWMPTLYPWGLEGGPSRGLLLGLPHWPRKLSQRWSGGMRVFWCTLKAMQPLHNLTGTCLTGTGKSIPGVTCLPGYVMPFTHIARHNELAHVSRGVHMFGEASIQSFGEAPIAAALSGW